MIKVEHEGGPLDRCSLSIATKVTPTRLHYALAPPGVAPVTPSGHLLVAADDTPMMMSGLPGEVEYALDRERSALREHDHYPEMEQGTALYVHVASEGS